MPPSLGARLITPDVGADIREAGYLAELGHMTSGLTRLMRPGDPGQRGGIDHVVWHGATL